MIKVLYILRRQEGMTADAFNAHWRDLHGPIAARMPGLVRLVQNRPYPDPYGQFLPADGVDEMYFESVEAMQAGLASPEGRAMLADFENFVDTRNSGPMVIEEDYQVL